MKETVAVLEVRTWANVTPGAKHYSGTLKFNGGTGVKLTLEYTLNAGQAARLNKSDRALGEHFAQWRVGHKCCRFETKGELIQAAIDAFTAHCVPLGAKVLLEGEMCVCDPQKVIFFTQDATHVAGKMNQVYQWAKHIGFWDDDDKSAEMTGLAENWDTYTKELEEL